MNKQDDTGISTSRHAAGVLPLLERAKSGSYKAPPVKRVHIPKGDGKSTRPIGIPTLEDKVLQRAIVMALEPVYETDFKEVSYGFRPGKSAQDALGRVSTSGEQREALLDEFERSGLKGAQFARLSGINYQTFASWVQKRRHERGQHVGGGLGRPLPKATGLALVEAMVPAHGADLHQDTRAGLQINLPGSATALITTPLQARLVAELPRALHTSC